MTVELVSVDVIAVGGVDALQHVVVLGKASLHDEPVHLFDGDCRGGSAQLLAQLRHKQFESLDDFARVQDTVPVLRNVRKGRIDRAEEVEGTHRWDKEQRHGGGRECVSLCDATLHCPSLPPAQNTHTHRAHANAGTGACRRRGSDQSHGRF